MEKNNLIFKKLIQNYKYIPTAHCNQTLDFENIEESTLNPGEFIQGKAWLSSCIYTDSPESYTPFRPIFKGHIETQGISGISWILNYMPVAKINLTTEGKRLAFLYPYKSPGFNIKLSFQGAPVDNYNLYMSLMYSKEEYPPENFSIEDDCFKPFPVLIPESMETETIVDFKGSLCCFDISAEEILPSLNATAKLNYSPFIREGMKPCCIDTCDGDKYIRAEKFKDFKNSRYNVKYGGISREFKFYAEPELPGFIPDIPHSLCRKIGIINEDFKSPAFSSTPNYGIGKAKAISSCCGPVLFNYVHGNIISLSVFYNLNDKAQQKKHEKSLNEFENILKDQLKEYMKTNFKTDINFVEI